MENIRILFLCLSHQFLSKLSVGVPFLLEVADRLKQIIPNCQFFLPIAPTTNAKEIKNFVSKNNPIAREYEASIKSIQNPKTEIEIEIDFTNRF